ncbi:MAG TPA: RNHCP domain-containing protein [Streptosporangiaceae bacterium]|nr:RNHCP domain-containing protein [Streptosporangiaceae bacterium]
MEPIAVTVRGEHRWMLIHRCTKCGRLRMNRTAHGRAEPDRAKSRSLAPHC